MNWATLAARGLRFHWRSHLGVLLGATLAAAILVGALAVGDSVRYSLRSLALARLGQVSLALSGGSRFFRAALADGIGAELRAPVAPVIVVRGTAASDDGERRAGRVQVIGADARFWQLGGSRPPAEATGETVVLNRRLAARLGARPGDEVLLRVEKPSLLSRDAPLSTVADASIALRLRVAGIAADADFGRFSLEANQIPPLNAVVPLATLQQALSMADRANVLLVGPVPAGGNAVAKANAALWKRWQLADAALELRELPGALELRTDRVFIDPPAAQAAQGAQPGARGVLTYFANELRVGDRATPYSTVTALPPPAGNAVLRDPLEVLLAGLNDDEIVVNQWLAQDLQARPGDLLRLTYYVVGPMRRLEERSRTFRIRGVVPIEGAAADRELMPAFPGVADRPNCRDWEPGIPVDLNRIRDQDEAYWDAHRGTPKAFVSLRAGQAMWNNRFGNLTAVRYPLGGATGAARKGARATVEACIRMALNPASIGLFFQPVREQALAATSPTMDFGQLFLGFSLFLIVAALLLAALLFSLGIEQRAEEVGTLLAVGIPHKGVRRLFLLEGAGVALLASLLGALLGTLYTRGVLRGLTGIWSGAVANSELRFHADSATIATGAAAAFLTALFSVWLVVRKQGRAPVRELLAPGAGTELPRGPGRRRRAPGVITAAIAFVGALGMIGAGLAGGAGEAAGAFFGAGALLLIAGLAACRVLLARLAEAPPERELTLPSLGARNSGRRPGRSLSAIALLACGSFMVVAVGASRHDPNQDAGRRASGTGGFAFFGESTLPVHHDLNRPDGQAEYGLDEEALRGVEVVPLRLREGDEASCLNLNRAQTPRILGVDPEALARRGAFTFSSTAAARRRPWELLGRREKDGAIPAIGDTNTVMWSLGKGAGDIVTLTDDQGQDLKLRIVGILSNSILQGGLLISEENFIRHFPERSGYQLFLVDAPAARRAEAAQELGRGLEDVGLELTPAAERLADFATVENTYLSIFALLGGLGLLLGSLGLGVVVLRNVLERRGELGLLRAVGFAVPALRRLVLSEHLLLLVLGLGVGLVAALLAVLPALRSPGAGVPVVSLAGILGGVCVSGFVWVWGATSLALRGPLMTALRNE